MLNKMCWRDTMSNDLARSLLFLGWTHFLLSLNKKWQQSMRLEVNESVKQRTLINED